MIQLLKNEGLERNSKMYLFSMLFPFIARESFGGTRLLRRADMNIGAHVSTFVRIRCKLVDPATDRPAGGAVERKHVVFMGKCFTQG